MRKSGVLAAVGMSAALFAASEAGAVVNFSGNATATAVVSPNAGCAPLPFQGIASGSGTSVFGSFTYSHTACTQGATGQVRGTYLIDFGVDQFSGSFDGTAAATPTTGLFDLLFTYTITGGTGRFAGETGAFLNDGTVDVRGGPPSRLTFEFTPLPEPSTWAMMLIGFGAVGVAMRRRESNAPAFRPRPI